MTVKQKQIASTLMVDMNVDVSRDIPAIVMLVKVGNPLISLISHCDVCQGMSTHLPAIMMLVKVG